MGSWNWTFRLVEKLLIWRYIHPARTCLLSSQSPASKHGGQLLNKVFICSKNIIPSRTSRIFETMGNAVTFGPKNFSRTCLQGFWESGNLSGPLTAGQIDWPKFILFKLQLLIFRRWWQLWMRTTTTKQKYRINLFFVEFCSFSVLLPNSMSKLFNNRCSVSLSLKLLLHAYMHSNNRLFAWSGHMVQNHSCCYSYQFTGTCLCFGSPTAQLAH